jgi:CheY-like chemotaxis protein
LAGQAFGPLNDKQGRYVARITDSADHLLALINDLLDMAKIDAGAMEVHWEKLSAEEEIQGVVAIMTAQFRKKRLTAETEIAAGLPPIHGDRRKVKQILFNLLANAVKYTPEDGRIVVGAAPAESGMIRISVADTGVGIAPKDREMIFSEFQQADKARDEALGGIGLGLALSRRLVALHGGVIELESEVGRGSIFSFTLPVAPEASPSAAEAAVPDAPPATGAHWRILVAEDLQDNLDVALDMLGVEGHIPAVARNGREAVALASLFRPDLILMDIRMPEMDGIAATRAIRAMPGFEALPIVALTASADQTTIEECLGSGFTDHLPKPIRTVALRRMLERHLAATPSRKEAHAS